MYLTLPQIEAKSKEELVLELHALQTADGCLKHLGSLTERENKTGICILNTCENSFYVGPFTKLLEWLMTFMSELCKKNGQRTSDVLSHFLTQVVEEEKNDKTM